MKRVTVYLYELTDLQPARLARLRKRSKAELIREALDKFVATERGRQRSAPSWVGSAFRPKGLDYLELRP